MPALHEDDHQRGPTEVVYNVDYPLGETALALLREAGVEVRPGNFSSGLAGVGGLTDATSRKLVSI